jgi:catechol 2,3-dioxygenase
MKVMQRSYPGARFLAADGYHHHLGLNTWGSPRQPQPRDALGLASATFSRAGVTSEFELVDPDGIHVRVHPALVAA